MLAEGEGFEPPEACTSAVFKTRPNRPRAFAAVRLGRELSPRVAFAEACVRTCCCNSCCRRFFCADALAGLVVLLDVAECSGEQILILMKLVLEQGLP